MKSLEFIYQETEIHFLLDREGDVMVNATEMAKAFGKRTRDFLRLDFAKSYIDVLTQFLEEENNNINTRGDLRSNPVFLTQNTPQKDVSSADVRSKSAKTTKKSRKNDQFSSIVIKVEGRDTFFHRLLAIKFAAWLEPKFELWIYKMMDDILFGHYKQHWYAHAEQETARIRMESIKKEILTNPSAETVQAYFQSERDFKSAKAMKTAAIRSQLKLFYVTDDQTGSK